MKKIYTLLAVLTFSLLGLAQAPEKMSFQAVIRDGDNNLVMDEQVGMQISILQGATDGTLVYSETHSTTTNTNGLVSIEIGMGTTSDDFSEIDWANGPYFIKTETDPDGGTSYSITGTSQLLSVPFALHAKSADTFLGTITETDPVYAGSVAKGITEGDTSSWNDKLDSFVELDPVYAASVAKGITQADTALWNTNIDETDPVFGGSLAMGITQADTSSWNNKFEAVVDGSSADDLITFDGTNWVSRGALVANTGGNQAQNNMQPWIAINYIIALYGVYPSRNSVEPFIAEIIMFGGNFAPRSWAFCDGQLLPISSNQALYSLLGTTYGGDGRTTMALPDLRGRSPIHAGNGPGLSQRRLGAKGGSETNVMTVVQMPSHTHTITYQ